MTAYASVDDFLAAFADDQFTPEAELAAPQLRARRWIPADELVELLSRHSSDPGLRSELAAHEVPEIRDVVRRLVANLGTHVVAELARADRRLPSRWSKDDDPLGAGRLDEVVAAAKRFGPSQ